jgi:hypothetical protein
MFRGFCVLFMIEAHVSNATILKSIHKTSTFHYIDLFHGSISASFIFIAGFAFMLTLEKKWDDLIRPGKTLFLQIRRLLFILGVGYWLHVPVWSLRKMLQLNDSQLIRFLRADVLMCISISLLISLGIALLIRRKNLIPRLLLILGIFVVLITPQLYEMNARNFLPLWLALYINNQYSSLFPLFSWSANVLIGVSVGSLFLRAVSAGRAKTLFTVMAVSGAIMVIAAFALFYLPWSYHTYTDVARASPRHFMMRLGAVFFMLALTWFYEYWRKPERSILGVLGQESLFIYGFHLLIVYGSQFTSHNLARDIGNTLTYLPSLGLTILIILISGSIGYAWHMAKTNYPKQAKIFFYTLCIIYFAVFFLK